MRFQPEGNEKGNTVIGQKVCARGWSDSLEFVLTSDKTLKIQALILVTKKSLKTQCRISQLK